MAASTIQSRLAALLGSAWHVNPVAFLNQLAMEIEGGQGDDAAGVNPAITNIATVGAGVLTAAALAGGVVNRTGSTAAYSDATDTAAAIIAALANQNVGTSQFVYLINDTAYAQTVTGGTGVTVSGNAIIAPFSVGEFLLTIASATTATLAAVGAEALTTAGLLNSQISTAGVGNGADTSEDTLFTFTLPANMMGAVASGVRMTVYGAVGPGTNVKTLRLHFGTGVTFAVGLGTIASQGFKAVLDVFNGSAVSLQLAQGIAQIGSTLITSPVLPGAEPQTAGVVMKATGQAVAINDIVANMFEVDALG